MLAKIKTLGGWTIALVIAIAIINPTFAAEIVSTAFTAVAQAGGNLTTFIRQM